MKQEPLKRRRPAARKRGQKQTLRAVVLSVLAVSVIALCLGIWTRLPGEDVPVGGVEPPEEVLSCFIRCDPGAGARTAACGGNHPFFRNRR